MNKIDIKDLKNALTRDYYEYLNDLQDKEVRFIAERGVFCMDQLTLKEVFTLKERVNNV